MRKFLLLLLVVAGISTTEVNACVSVGNNQTYTVDSSGCVPF